MRTHAHARAHTHVPAPRHTHTHERAHTHTHKQVHNAHTRMCTHTHTHTHTRTQTHAHTHTRAQARPFAAQRAKGPRIGHTGLNKWIANKWLVCPSCGSHRGFIKWFFKNRKLVTRLYGILHRIYMVLANPTSYIYGSGQPYIVYIWLWLTLHRIYMVMANPTSYIYGYGQPYIVYIWFWPTLGISGSRGIVILPL